MFVLLAGSFFLELSKALGLVFATSELSFLALHREASALTLAGEMMTCWHNIEKS